MKKVRVFELKFARLVTGLKLVSTIAETMNKKPKEYLPREMALSLNHALESVKAWNWCFSINRNDEELDNTLDSLCEDLFQIMEQVNENGDLKKQLALLRMFGEQDGVKEASKFIETIYPLLEKIDQQDDFIKHKFERNLKTFVTKNCK